MIKVDKKRKSRSGSKSQGTIPAFLLKTYEILENPTFSDIISWNKEGNAFIVKKINDFSEKILPKYFKHNNFASFVRQLNMYDFHKSRHENNENEFKHKLFKRGQKHLLADIKRKISDGPTYPNNQLVPAGKEYDMDKFKKEAMHFSSELGSLKRNQNDLEKVTNMIYEQNSKLLKENKLLWNELIKSKEKYERRIDKLIMFIITLMRHGNNQLGPSDNRKMLTNSEISETLNQITGDPEQGKKFFENNERMIMPNKKEEERMYQKIADFFKNRSGGDTSIDSFFEQMQNGNNEENQPEIPIDDQQNLNPNLIYPAPTEDQNQFDQNQLRRRGRQRRALPDEIKKEDAFGALPTKKLKTENEPLPLYTVDQNIMHQAMPQQTPTPISMIPPDMSGNQAPINLMSQDLTNADLRREMPSFSLDMSRGPSFLESDVPPLLQQKSSNDFMFTNQTAYANPMKESEMNEAFQMNPYENQEDKMQDYNQIPNNYLPINENLFSPPPFMNVPSNTSINGFNFGQPFDDPTIYRN